MQDEQKLIKCEKCGQDLNEQAKFCFACGAKVVHSDEKITCPACGASVVDGLFCSECGASLSAHTEETHAVHAHSEDGVETLLEKAKTLLSLEQYERACDVYEKIIDAHPDDFHGWWGLLAASTKNLTAEPSSQKVDLALTMKNVKKLASPEEYAVCEKKFIAYLMRVDTLGYMVFEDEKLMARYTETRLKRADKLLAEGNFSEAYEMYESVVDAAEEDYRGWWGCVLASTKNLTEEAEENFDLVTGMRNIKRLAPPEEYASREKAFVAFLKETESRPYVKEEEKDFEKKLAVLEKARIPFLDGAKAYESIEKQERADFASATKKRSDAIADLKAKVAVFEKQHTECEEAIEKKGGRRKLSIFCIILGVFLAIIGIANETVALIVIGLIAAFIVGGILLGTSNTDADVTNNDRAKKEITKHRGELSSAITDDEKAKTTFAEASESRNKAIALMNEKTQEIDSVIEKIKAFQTLPEEDRILYWLKDDCETYEVAYTEPYNEESGNIINDVYDALYEKKFPVLLRCDACGNQTIAYVDILGKFNRFDHISCSFCEEKVYLSNFLNDDGTPNVEELRRGANYRRYLAYGGGDDEYDEPEDEYADEGYDEDDEDMCEYEADESHAVYLVSVGSYPQGVAKVIDDVLYCGMSEAREFVTDVALPCWLTSSSKKEAEQFASRLRAAGATVEVRED